MKLQLLSYRLKNLKYIFHTKKILNKRDNN